MVQIAFLTLLLGLNSGTVPVEISASGPVAVIELILDGAPAGRLGGPPWMARVDFGTDLLPHELVARALGPDGAELARTRQWINLPRPPAEVALALEPGEKGGPPRVRLAWQSLVAGAPKQVSLALDGKPVAVDRDGRAPLPRLEADVPHVLSAEVAFGPGLVARRDVVLGAEGSEAFGELTAVAVRTRGGRLPPPERLKGWFTAGGVPLAVTAVEDDNFGQVIVVRDAAVPDLVRKAWGGTGSSVALPGSTLARGVRVRFLWSKPRLNLTPGVAAELFDSSQEFVSRDLGFDYLLSRVVYAGEKGGGQHLADAVAVAGLQALAGHHPRAVLLVLGPQPEDGSRYSPAAIRRYLAALRVPLHVWSLAPPAARPSDSPSVTFVSPSTAAAWGATDVSNRRRLLEAIGQLRQDLDRQRIVFVEGLHLPQSVALSPAAGAEIELP